MSVEGHHRTLGQEGQHAGAGGGSGGVEGLLVTVASLRRFFHAAEPKLLPV